MGERRPTREPPDHSFRNFYNRTSSAAKNWASYELGRHSSIATDDVVQASYEVMYKKWHKTYASWPDQRVDSYLTTVITNRCKDYFRTLKDHASIDDIHFLNAEREAAHLAAAHEAASLRLESVTYGMSADEMQILLGNRDNIRHLNLTDNAYYLRRARLLDQVRSRLEEKR